MADTPTTVSPVAVDARRPPAGEVLMTLGPIRFSVQETAYQRLRRETEVRTARMDRAGGKTARQVLGTDQTLELEGVVYGAQRGGLGRVQSFHDLAEDQQPLMLTDGMGNVWGRYVVERVDEDATLHTPYGAPLRQAFRINLGRYGEDK